MLITRQAITLTATLKTNPKIKNRLPVYVISNQRYIPAKSTKLSRQHKKKTEEKVKQILW